MEPSFIIRVQKMTDLEKAIDAAGSWLELVGTEVLAHQQLLKAEVKKLRASLVASKPQSGSLAASP